MIVGKSAICVPQLQVRVDNNIPVELQLFDDFDKFDFEFLLQTVSGVKGLNIVHVHMPIRKPIPSNIDYILDSRCYSDFKRTIRFAGELSKIYITSL